MDVDDATWEGIDQEIGHQRQESCQHDKVNTILLQQGHHHLLVVQLCLGSHSCGHTQFLCSHQRIGIGLVAHYQRTVHAVRPFEILDQILTVRATT